MVDVEQLMHGRGYIKNATLRGGEHEVAIVFEKATYKSHLYCEVTPSTENFIFYYFTDDVIKITSNELGSVSNEKHFSRWEQKILEVINTLEIVA